MYTQAVLEQIIRFNTNDDVTSAAFRRWQQIQNLKNQLAACFEHEEDFLLAAIRDLERASLTD